MGWHASRDGAVRGHLTPRSQVRVLLGALGKEAANAGLQCCGFYDDIVLLDSSAGARVETARSLGARRRLRLRLLPLALALLLGHALARGLRSRRHPESALAPARRPARAGGRAQALAAGAAGRRSGPLRQGLRNASSRPPSASWERSCSGRPARTSPTTAFTCPRSANGSSRSSRPARTSSPSSARRPHPGKPQGPDRAADPGARPCVQLNHWLRRPSRSLVAYVA